ncbi:MAG TPA: DUF4855 domain-containing protein [Armatimonadetes bacterium]|nr:DUF4855 domain-containing protein [Armatimonadota bacterium]
MWLLLTFLLSCLATAASAAPGFCPPASPQSGGMRDIMLIYEGGKAWKPEEFRPYVAYIDERGEPKDWFYDAFLFLMFGGAPSGATYIDGATTRADWEHFLNVTFARDRCLDALDQEIEAVGRRLGKPGRVCPVILMIPYPSSRAKAFGDVDGDGVSEDLSLREDRVKAVRWFLDEALARWKALAPRHLKLWGFYWMNEGISRSDEAIVKATADLVHARGYGLHWIPWFRAPGLEKWRELGIDFAIVQPNYAFTQPGRGFVLADENRLTLNANDARRLGLGVEMETPFALPGDPGARWLFQQYLNHGVDALDGYQHGAVRAYYQGGDVIARLAASTHPGERQLYDDLYRFHKGTYTRRPTSLAEGAHCLLQVASGTPVLEPRLVDGTWHTQAGREDALIPMKGGSATIMIELPAPTLVDDVRLHVAAKERAGLPSAVRVYTADAGSDAFVLRAETKAVSAERCGAWLAGFALLHFSPAPAQRVRIEVAGGTDSLFLGEVVVPPAAHPLWGAIARAEGETAAEGSPAWLTEGRRDAVPLRWSKGPARLLFECSEMIGAQVRVRVRKAPGHPAPSLRVRVAPEGAWEQGEVVWQDPGRALLSARLPLAPVRQLALEMDGAGEIALEDVQVLPMRSWAQDCPYTLTPSFEAKYPDSGGELTDGKVCEQGFGDGRTVGWLSTNPSVVLDLGALREVDGVGAHVEGGGYAFVLFPSRLAVQLSSDGATWRSVAATESLAEKTAERVVGDEIDALGWMRAAFPRQQARFVRFDFTARGWVMLSELAVFSGGVNIAAGCTYHLSPSPTSEAKYADGAAYLTDGIYAPAGGGWRGRVGWCEGEPQITLDLLKPRPVALVRAHLSGGGRAGVHFPEEMRVELSADGTTWPAPLVTTEHPEETEQRAAVAFMTVRVAPAVNARYVRLSFKRRGWLMVDEIDCYGPEGG